MANKTTEDFSAVPTPAAADLTLLWQGGVQFNMTLEQLADFLSGTAHSYTETLNTDGSNSTYAITHNLDNANPIVTVIDSSDVYSAVGYTVTSDNVVTLNFGSPPGVATWTVTVRI